MKTAEIINAMIEYFGTDLKRINHLLKVYAFSKTIGELEGLSKEDLSVLEAAAAVHDIGIKLSEIKYGSSAGKYQELEGPSEAKALLEALGCDEDFIQKVCYIVGHHHTYNNIDGIAYQILVEADFLVNLYEDGASLSAAQRADEIFKTKAGKALLKTMYLEQ